MPLYEYQCSDCGRLTEVIQKFSDAPLSTCSECGGRMERLLSAPAIQFKGSGWYITDYAKKSNGGDSPARSTESNKEPATKEPKTEGKAPAKAN